MHGLLVVWFHTLEKKIKLLEDFNFKGYSQRENIPAEVNGLFRFDS